MARINLLPWRVERRKQRQKEFFAMLGASALGAALIAFLIVNYYSRQIDGQTERNQFLEQKIARLVKLLDPPDVLTAEVDDLVVHQGGGPQRAAKLRHDRLPWR